MRHRVTVRKSLQICGVVQGVGFRPFVYNLANRLSLTGFVGNNAAGVLIEVQGEQEALHLFRAELQRNPPPLAQIASITEEPLTSLPEETSFRILESEQHSPGTAWISPDIATCADCLREMLDPADRRYRYPFINCTNCGPRFTITLRTPYDRPSTTMAGFQMCSVCQAEYDTPLDRRFHAQPNACPICGPHLTWVESGTTALHREEALAGAQHALRAGRIVAVKGIGGFHLAVDAANHDAVLRLRERKHRYGKPLAVMVADIAAARRLASFGKAEEALLTSKERPIVLLQAHTHHGLSTAIAPGTHEIGIMLSYSGLHTLLLDSLGPLVMTSGNLSEQPILWQNDAALADLTGIADGFLLHNRDIHVPCDDSVVRILNKEGESPLRRSRGYAPLPIRLPSRGSSEQQPLAVLAVGAELKSTFCLTRSDSAFMSQHLGDMASYETVMALERAVEHFTDIFRIQPGIVTCDLHPGYLSSQWAARYAEQRQLPLLRVQHHHAHLAAAMADHGLDGASPVLGIIFDGTGYGTDGTIWGGEFLSGDYSSFRRHLRLRPLPLPGGDAAVRHPYRMALAAMHDAELAWEEALAVVRQTPVAERAILRQQLQRGFNVTASSSMGRLFDAVAGILNLQRSVQFEAQAAIELEAISSPPDAFEPYSFAIEPVETAAGESLHEIDTRPLLRLVTEDVRRGVASSAIAGRFHQTVLKMTLSSAEHVRNTTGINTVVLSGGVWQNRLLATHVPTALRHLGFQVLEHRCVPSNDGGLALGQAAIAMSRIISPET